MKAPGDDGYSFPCGNTKPIEEYYSALCKENARLREALSLIAVPKRPDGTYNRDREACGLLARKALSPNESEAKK